MNEEIDETEYHQDFTTASEWEIFIARLEEIINQWKTDDLKNNEQISDSGIWTIKSEKINFAECEFYFDLYRKVCKKLSDDESPDSEEKPPKNPMDTLFDFELYNENYFEKHSFLSQWYGLDEFMIVYPSKNFTVTTESRIKILLSSIYIVAGNVNCVVPIFVQIHEPWQRFYLGVFEGNGIRTNFEMVHLKRGPPHCSYFTGLLDMFKTKISSPINIETITVSLQQTYVLNNFGQYSWTCDSIQHTDDSNFHIDNFSSLPMGVNLDPVDVIILNTTWSNLPDHLIVDNESYSDFDPVQAPKWSLRAKFFVEPVCLMGDVLMEFYHLFGNSCTIYDILGDYAATTQEMNPLDLLTEPAVPTISTLLSRAARNSLTRNVRGSAIPPIPETILVQLLYFLFPDADKQNAYPYEVVKEKEQDKENSDSDDLLKGFEQETKGCKTCSPKSLVWRLSIMLVVGLQSLGGVKAFAHIWYEFVQEMRYRWEKSIVIPGLAAGYPDLRTCLLHQKLQMLNSCIERKIAREQHLHTSTYDSAEGSSTDDDEFFDCSEKPDEESKRREKFSFWNQPVGRLGKFDGLKLLKTGDPLYIPVTQEPVIKTEDQLEEDTDVLLKLGSDAEASELRARIMSASLLSDMEAFKAANPGSVVEDFIRWYSPRDWIEEDELDEWGQQKGHLSPRMKIEENNIWVQTWKSAKPVPANRQKRLFDDTREAEKILQYLSYRTLSQVCEFIAPVLAHAAIYQLIDKSQDVLLELPSLPTHLSNLFKQTERISRETKLQLPRFETYIQEVTALELKISQVNSLQRKFNDWGSVNIELSDLLGNLVHGKEIEIENKHNSIIGKKIVKMFMDQQQSLNGNLIDNEQQQQDYNSSDDGNRSRMMQNLFPLPVEREFVMRTTAAKPAGYSAKCPQFMRAILSKNEFRLAGAFSEDIVFF